MTPAEEKLTGMLKAAGIAKKSSYRPGEVQQILGICERTFYNLVSRYEPDPETGKPMNPNSLDSFKLTHHRVRYDELVNFLGRNNTYQRNNADPRQMVMF